MIPSRFAAVLAAPLLLAACAEEKPLACPEVYVLGDAMEAVHFNGPGRDLIDVTWGGRIVDVRGTCEYEIHKQTGHAILSMEVSVGVEAERGPADTERRAAFQYFVSVVDQQKNILKKQTFDLIVPFEGNRTRLTVYDQPVVLDIPLKPEQGARHFEVFVGFQLSRDQLEFNRKRQESQR
jgi:hypothetical protein